MNGLIHKGQTLIAVIAFLFSAFFFSSPVCSQETQDDAVKTQETSSEEAPLSESDKKEEPQTVSMDQKEEESSEASSPVKEKELSSEQSSAEASVVSSDTLVINAWEASSNGNFEKLDEVLNTVLELFGEKAEEQQDSLNGFPPRGKEKEYQELNDVATIHFIKAEALMNHGRVEECVVLFEKTIKAYSWGQGYDPRMGVYWSVADKSQASINVMQGNVPETDPGHVDEALETLPSIHTPGTEQIVNYMRFGEFLDVGTPNYRYKTNDPQALSDAVGEGIYPNTGALLKDPGYKKAEEEGRLKGDHWDFVHSSDLEAAFYKWANAPEPWGMRLFYLGHILEKAGMYYEAIKAYHSIIIHFPKTVGWTYWQTPWYPAQAAVAKIKHIVRSHPELGLKVKWMGVKVTNGFDNDVSNDVIVTYPGVVTKKSGWDYIKEKFNLDTPHVPLGKVKRTVGEGKVQLVQYENGHWQMLVEGKPYIMRGMTYTPTRIGQSPDKGTLKSWMDEDINKNGLPDGPYDSWVDANRNNKQDPDEPVVGDFQLMKELGVNAIREYHQSYHMNKKVLRKMYEDYGFRVIMGDFLGKYTLGSGATWFEGTDYENPQHQKNMMASVREMVMEFKDEPYILLWVLGNENNYGVASNADKKPEIYFKFVNEVAKMIKSLDPDHPVALCNGDTLYLDVFAKYAPDVDIYAANVYRGNYGFGAFWEQVFDSSEKPAFITEYGCPAYAKHLTRDEAEEAQAGYQRGNWLDIEANTAGRSDGIGNALGGFVFQWLDEWWKNYEPFYHDKTSDAIGPFPSGYYYEEWFGIVGQGNGSDSPFLRQPRKSYFAYKEMWNK